MLSAKEYLEKAGLAQVDNNGLNLIEVTRHIEKTYLDFMDNIASNCDHRWRAIAKTHIEEGGMAIRKAIAHFEANQMKSEV